MKYLKIYSDAGSFNNGHKDPNKPMFGSFGSLIVNEDNEIIYQFSDWYEEITNNQGELFGFIKPYYEFLRRYKSKEEYTIEVISDSQYLINGVNKYLSGWKKKGWKSTTGEVKNKKMWQIIDRMLQLYKDRITLIFTWQKGHVGKKTTCEENPNVYFNEVCDSLATKQIEYASGKENTMICPEKEFDNLIDKIYKNLKVEA